MDWVLTQVALCTDTQTVTVGNALGRAASSFSSLTSCKTETQHVRGWEVTCPKSHGRLAEDPGLALGLLTRCSDLSVLCVEGILSKVPHGPVTGIAWALLEFLWLYPAPPLRFWFICSGIKTELSVYF